MNKKSILLGIALAVVIVFGITLESKAAQKEQPKKAKPMAMVKESWEVEWETTIEKAKKEGTLVIYTGRSPHTRNMISKAFKSKYGLEIVWTAGRSSEIAAKITAERRAGLHLVDFVIVGANTLISFLKPIGGIDPLPPTFILPELKDEKAWYHGRYPFTDKDRMIFQQVYYPQEPININTNLIKKEEVGSYYDLLKPKWKGEKFLMGDPTVTGSASSWFRAMVYEGFGPVLGVDYMRKLVNQKPIIIRDYRQASEWVLRGKYPLALAIDIRGILLGWRESGVQVPIEAITPKEGTYMATAGSALALVNKAPHPNAAKVFINWILSREGQILYSRSVLNQSSRVDIPEPYEISPAIIRREPGVKYIDAETEELYLHANEFAKMAKDIFGDITK